MSGLQHQWIDDLETFRSRAAEWDGALLASGEQNPFLLSDFILTWSKYFLQPGALRLLVMTDGLHIVGCLPLFVRRDGVRHGCARRLSYVGGWAANYTEPFCASADGSALSVVREALLARQDWDVFRLTEVRSRSRFLSECRQRAPDASFPIEVSEDHADWSIDLSHGVEAYLQTISKKLRRDLRSKRRHAVARYGELTLKAVHGPEEVARSFDLYTRFSCEAFRARHRRSAFEDHHQQAFFREFLVAMERRQRLDAHLLTAGDHVLAVSFAYRFGPGFNWVLTAFNCEDEYLRPGYLLIEDIIQELWRRGEPRYNWYGHDRFYKTQWCNTKTPLYSVTIVKPTWAGAWYRRVRWAERCVRSTPLALRAVRSLRRVREQVVGAGSPP